MLHSLSLVDYQAKGSAVFNLGASRPVQDESGKNILPIATIADSKHIHNTHK